METDVQRLLIMAQLQKEIAELLKSGHSLSSPRVVELSRQLDELVLAFYENKPKR